MRANLTQPPASWRRLRVVSDPYALLTELANALEPGGWALVGGLMVHCHAQRAGVTHVRPTHDADIVVELQTQTYATHARALEDIGFTPHESLDDAAPFHRFERGADNVDLMVPDRASWSPRYRGRELIRVPGSGSALKRTIPHALPDGTSIRIPDLASALALKGAAHQVPSVNAVRHLQDSVTLLACAGPAGLDPAPSKSMRANINHLVKCLASTAEAWSLAAPQNRVRAQQCIQTLRPDWIAPSFLGSTTTTTTRRRRPGR